MPEGLSAALQRWFGTATLSPRQVAAIILPVLVSQAFVIGFSALTPAIVAPAGVAAMGAVSTIEYVNVLTTSSFIALAVAGSVLVAQQLGSGRRDAVRRAVGGTLAAAVGVAVLLAAAVLLAHGPILQLLLGGAGQELIDPARSYLIGSAIAYPFTAISEAVAAAFRGTGRTAPALWLTVAGNGTFLVLAVGLVSGLGMGVTGLAVALVTARVLSAAFAVLLLASDRHLRPAGMPDLHLVVRVLLIGTPFVAEQAVILGGKLIVQVLVVGMGTDAIAANAIGQSLVSIAELVAQAMSVAIVPIVGQAIGAGRPDDARRLIRSFLWTATLLSAIPTAAMAICFPWLLGLFRTPPEIVDEVTAIFLLAAAGRLLGLWSLSYVLPSGLRAAGDAVFTTWVAMASMAVRVPMIWVVGVQLEGGVVGVWAVMVGEWAVRAFAYGLRFRGFGWQGKTFVVPATGPLRVVD